MTNTDWILSGLYRWWGFHPGWDLGHMCPCSLQCSEATSLAPRLLLRSVSHLFSAVWPQSEQLNDTLLLLEQWGVQIFSMVEKRIALSAPEMNTDWLVLWKMKSILPLERQNIKDMFLISLCHWTNGIGRCSCCTERWWIINWQGK